jgi:hypothetical protein
MSKLGFEEIHEGMDGMYNEPCTVIYNGDTAVYKDSVAPINRLDIGAIALHNNELHYFAEDDCNF